MMSKYLFSFIILFFLSTSPVFAQYSAEKVTRVGNPASVATPNGSFVFYCQGDPAWDNRSSCGLGAAGCGPSSLAMILSTFGVTMTPPQVFEKFKETGGWLASSCESSVSGPLGSAWLKTTLGFEVVMICKMDCNTIDPQVAKEYLDNGYLIFGSSIQYPCVSCKTPGSRINHIFSADGINIAAGTMSIRDPNNCSYSDGKEIQANVNRRINGDFPWYYAYAIKKISN